MEQFPAAHHLLWRAATDSATPFRAALEPKKRMCLTIRPKKIQLLGFATLPRQCNSWLRHISCGKLPGELVVYEIQEAALMFPSVPPLKVVASFSLSMVHAGLILSQLSVSPAGNQKDDGAERAPPVPSARTDADQTEAEPPAAT